MLKSVRTLAAVVLFAVGLGGCATTKNASPREEAASFYPLHEGNSWTYQVRPAPPGRDKERVEIVQRDKDGFFLDNRGVRMRADALGLFDGTRYLLQPPLKAGRSWKAIPSPSVVERYQIIADGVKVSVPAGTFEDCVKVQATVVAQPDPKVCTTPLTLVTVWTFARGVGMLEMVQNMKCGSEPLQRTASFKLVEYDLKKPVKTP